MAATLIASERDLIIGAGFDFTLAISDGGATFAISKRAGSWGGRFGCSPRGTLVAVTPTGQRVRMGGRFDGMVRVRIDVAVDAERADSSVVFGEGEHFGGWAPASIFPRFN
jgi:hypothetical protein